LIYSMFRPMLTVRGFAVPVIKVSVQSETTLKSTI
jgi:hypothetical protein